MKPKQVANKTPSVRLGLWGQVFGKTRMTAEGARLYPFLNAMRETGIRCYGQRCHGEQLQGVIFSKDCKKLRQLAQQYHIIVTEREERTLFAFLRRYRLRIGIPLGGLLAAAFLVYCCNVVMVIEVQGNQNVSEETILAVLEDCGVEHGTFIGAISFAKCEHQLRAGVPELRRVAIRHTGNRLVVEVTETPEEVDSVQKRVPCNIVAAYDAEIVSVSVRSGQLMRLVGEPVQKGDLLVSGVQLDAQGHIRFRHAMAEITGIYTIKETFTCAYEQVIRTDSGQEQERTYLDFFTLHIPLSKGYHPYAAYNLSEERTPLTLFGKELPVAVCREICTEYTETVLQFTSEEAKADLEQQMQRYEMNFLQDTEIVEQKTVYTEKETALEVTVSYTLKGNIGEQKELFLKE